MVRSGLEAEVEVVVAEEALLAMHTFGESWQVEVGGDISVTDILQMEEILLSSAMESASSVQHMVEVSGPQSKHLPLLTIPSLKEPV